MEWLAVAVGTLAVVITVFLRGKDAGRVQADNDTNTEILDNVAKAKKAADDVAAMPADDRRERLRQYTKK